MSIKHTWTTAVKNDAGATVISDTDVLSASAEENFEMSVAGGNTTDEVVVGIDVSQIVSFFVQSDVAVTMKTYNGVTLKDTFPLAAKKAIGWNSNDVVNSNPLLANGDLTKITFTNAGTGTASIRGGFLLDV